MTVEIQRAVEGDAPAVAAIYNQGIAARNATFETTPRRPEDMRERMGEGSLRHPVLVARKDGRVLGFASLSAYRPRECYAGIAEFSVYVDAAHRGQGVGRLLVSALLAEALSLGHWKILSRIFPFNAGSRALCRSLGFREVGVYEKHARLDGAWQDVVIVECLIPENLQ